MSGFFQDLLKGTAEGFFGSDYLRDYTHASKTFRSNAYQNAPKLKFLFHTYFEINTPAYLDSGFLCVNPFTESVPRNNYGLLVKDVKLPGYTFNTTQLNQYNRKRIVQTKIKYEPVTITFHDDNASQATKLWEAYYRYNYRDGSQPGVIFSGNRGNPSGGDVDYNTRTIYNPEITTSDWGYIGDTYSGSNKKVPFFKNITVFGFYQHNFTAYTLINPIITSFAHDTYAYEQGSGIMQNTMTIDYETVVYNYGAIDGRDPSNIVTGFGLEENYDRRISPITVPGANAKILGPGGLVDAVGGTLQSLGDGNILGAIKAAGTAYNTFKNKNLKQVAKQELLNGVTAALTNPNVTRNISAWAQKVGSTTATTGTAGSPTVGAATEEVTTRPSRLGATDAVTTRPTRLAGSQVNSSGATSYPAPLTNNTSRTKF